MKWTPARHKTLRIAALGIDHPGSDGVRAALEKRGLLFWTNPPRCLRMNYDREQFGPAWQITDLGRKTLVIWDIQHPNAKSEPTAPLLAQVGSTDGL